MDIALNLVLNTTLLLSLCIIFNLFYQKLRTQIMLYRIFGGIILGLAGIAIVTIAIRLPNNVLFDTRSILLSVSGLFYGAVPTVIAAAIIALYRVAIGGREFEVIPLPEWIVAKADALRASERFFWPVER